MFNRPFFRVSDPGPGLPSQKSNSILIFPVVSVGNVTQLAADLLIEGLRLSQVGIFDPSYHVPVVGGQDIQTNINISTPMELFGLPGGDIFVLQQRSPVLKDRKGDFIPKMQEMVESSGFSSVLYLVGSDQSARSDAQMGSIHYHILAKHTTRDSIVTTPLASLLGLPLLDQTQENQDTKENIVIPGAGLARRLLNTPGTTPRIALVQYIAEGDNIPDAHAMTAMVAKLLKIDVKDWKQPASWNFAMYGTPHDQQLFG